MEEFYGEVTSTKENDLNGKYIKVQIYTKNGNFAGTKYLQIEGCEENEPKKFAVYFTADNIEYYTIEILDNTEEVQKEEKEAIELYGSYFTEKDLRVYKILLLLIGVSYL